MREIIAWLRGTRVRERPETWCLSHLQDILYNVIFVGKPHEIRLHVACTTRPRFDRPSYARLEPIAR